MQQTALVSQKSTESIMIGPIANRRVVFLCLSTVTWIQRHEWPSKSPLDRDWKDLVEDVTVRKVFAFNRYDVSSHTSNTIVEEIKKIRVWWNTIIGDNGIAENDTQKAQ